MKGLGTSSTGRAYQFVDTKAKSGEVYGYKVQSLATDGTVKDIWAQDKIAVATPISYALYQNFPNPFNPSTTIRFDLKEQSMVTLEVYNMLGQKVESWNYGMMEAGRYDKMVDMGRLPSGVYYYRMVAQGKNNEGFISIRKAMMIK